MATNPVAEVLSLLEDQWNPDNTNGVTPIFRSITTLKRLDVGNLNSRSAILVWRPSRTQEPAGIGALHKNYHDELQIDIRTALAEGFFWMIVAEVDRILDANIKTAVTGYDILNPDVPTRQDLSNKSKNFYRYLIPIRLERYAEART